MSQDDVETPSAPTETDFPADTPEPAAPALPADPAAWRAVLSAVPPRDLLRIVQQDRFLSARVLTGFRAAPDTLRRPQVMDRLAKELSKLPKIAEAVVALSESLATPAGVASESADTEASPEPSADVSTVPTPAASDTPPAPRDEKQSQALRETVNRQKTQLRDKEAQLHELQAALAAMQKERDQARTETETVRTSLKTLEAEHERQKRLREREERKQAAPKVVEKPAAKPAVAPTVVAPATSTAGGFGDTIADTLTRLLNRARWETVAEICREALGQGATGSPLPPLVRGRLHGFYAGALYGLGDDTTGEEQDRLSITALLDAGDAARAAEAVARLLTHATTVKPGSTTLIKRLEQLASYTGQAEAVQEIFRRMHIAAPDAHRRLLAALGSGGAGTKRNSLIAAPRTAEAPLLGPDETIVLAPPGENTLSVTARRVVEAVDAGEEEWVLRLRRVLTALTNAKHPDSQRLLEAVAALQPVAAQPFLQRTLRAVLVDASNVARHDPDPLAQLVTSRGPAPARVRHLTQMRDFLLQRGYFPVLLIADATLAFVADEAEAYRALVDKHVVYEVPSGTTADEVLLSEARLRGAPIVSNDTFSDWQDAAQIERFQFDFSTGRIALHPVK